MNNLSKNITTFLFTCSVLILFLTSQVRADEFALVPSHPDPRDKTSFTMIQKKLNRQDNLSDDFSIVNLTNNKLNFKIYTDDKNNILDIKTDKISVEAKERIKVDYHVRIPTKLIDGEYVIHAYAKDEASNQTSKPLVFDFFVGDNLKAKAKLLDASIVTDGNKLAISYKIQNSGNKRLDSLGLNLKLRNKIKPLSYLVESYDYYWGENINILPGEEKTFNHQIESNLIASNYEVQFTVNSENTKETKNLFLSAVSLYGVLRLSLYLIAGLILAALLLFILLKTSALKKLTLLISKLKVKKVETSSKFNLNNMIKNEGPQEKPTLRESVISKEGVEGLVKEIMKEETTLIDSKDLSYEKIFFEVRKIVRQEIELWKEMEKFRNELKNDIKKEEEIRRRLKEKMF